MRVCRVVACSGQFGVRVVGGFGGRGVVRWEGVKVVAGVRSSGVLGCVLREVVRVQGCRGGVVSEGG